MEFVENEDISVSRATSEQQLKLFNTNRYSNDSGVVDIDLRPLDITEIHRLSAIGTGRSRPYSALNPSTTRMHTYHTCWSALLTLTTLRVFAVQKQY